MICAGSIRLLLYSPLFIKVSVKKGRGKKQIQSNALTTIGELKCANFFIIIFFLKALGLNVIMM